MGIAGSAVTNTTKSVSEVQKQANDYKFEAAKLYAQLKKQVPVIKDLNVKNIKLEGCLEDIKLKFEEEHLNHATSVQLLRVEIRRLMADRSDLKQSRLDMERGNIQTDTKVQLLQEIAEKMKMERNELQRIVFKVTKRAEDAERRIYDAKISARKIVKMESIPKSQNSLPQLETISKTKTSLKTNPELPKGSRDNITELPGTPSFLI